MASSTSSQPFYWFLACRVDDSSQSREGIYSTLKSKVKNSKLSDFTAIFDVPSNLKYGRFDDLIRIADELVKHDALCETVCRRIERMGLEIDPGMDFQIVWQRNTFSAEEYISRWVWDDAKYPRNRFLKENIDTLVSAVSKLDEEVRLKSSVFNEVKQNSANVAKREGGAFVQRDLTDILTPEVVAPDDFIETEHFTTPVCVVPKQEESTFLAQYEKWGPGVVPRSAKKFSVVDRDGTGLIRVVVLRSGMEDFRTDAKQKRVLVRDFAYSESGYKMRIEEKSKLEIEKSRQENVLTLICKAAFSEVFIAWLHVKAIKIFVESTLRYGIPPRFAAFVVRLTNRSKEAKMRKELDEALNIGGPMMGKAFITSATNKSSKQTDTTSGGPGVDTYDDEYYSYVSVEMQPFVSFVPH